jgi:3-hydroxyisobutyrate dehydrogenase-like beta-hydroxyacid dehydrogenase
MIAVISAVTASQTVAVAQAAAPGLAPGAFFLDFNSASPGAKAQAAQVVNAAGGRYVEGAVMTSVPPYRLRVPLLLGGPEAAALAPLLNALGFDAKVASEQLGQCVGNLADQGQVIADALDELLTRSWG